MQSSPAFRAPMSGFASLPDRGELLAYEKTRQVKHKGAYTAYPVAISEAHALRAMQSGEMVVNAPNGEPIRLKYERHEESPDGNWTWIGSNRSEEHTSELQSLMRISYAVFCLKKTKQIWNSCILF